jgi:dCTP deaminase
MDLTLGHDGYWLKRGAVKPQNSYLHFLLDSGTDLVQPLQFEIDGSLVLEKGNTYVFRIEQRLNPFLQSEDIYGQATARSTIGRLDVLARLIVDGMDRYEEFIPTRIASGEMFLEITPLTFRVRVKPGIPISQLRLFYGEPETSIIKGKELFRTVLPNIEMQENERDGCLTLDLSEPPNANTQAGSAFRAINNPEPIPLWTTDPKPNPKQYFELTPAEQHGSHKRLAVETGRFYILRSKQRIRLTKNVAVYCRATDETFGEMRIHYAGFVHPFFGRQRKDGGDKGTPLCFEVRGHDVQLVLNDGEKMAQLDFYRMSEDCLEEVTTEEKEPQKRDYTDQDLQLSKIFADWN